MFFNFLGPNFLAPKSSQQVGKQPALGATHGFSTSFSGASCNSICSRKYVICFICNPTPLFQERHENFYEIFLSHLVSTACKLTPFQMQLESVLNKPVSEAAIQKCS